MVSFGSGKFQDDYSVPSSDLNDMPAQELSVLPQPRIFPSRPLGLRVVSETFHRKYRSQIYPDMNARRHLVEVAHEKRTKTPTTFCHGR
jgi:hypothetical protein